MRKRNEWSTEIPDYKKKDKNEDMDVSSLQFQVDSIMNSDYLMTGAFLIFSSFLLYIDFLTYSNSF